MGRDALSGLRRAAGGAARRPWAARPGHAGPGWTGSARSCSRSAAPACRWSWSSAASAGAFRPSVELNAFRIVQEALTNSLRHSGRTLVTVTLTYGDDALDIDVADAGGTGSTERVQAGDAEDAPPVGGFGLVGMRQRVERLGGGMTAGSDGGERLPGVGPGCRWQSVRTTGTAIAG